MCFFFCLAQLQNPSIGRTYLIQTPQNQILQHQLVGPKCHMILFLHLWILKFYFLFPRAFNGSLLPKATRAISIGCYYRGRNAPLQMGQFRYIWAIFIFHLFMQWALLQNPACPYCTLPSTTIMNCNWSGLHSNQRGSPLD